MALNSQFGTLLLKLNTADEEKSVDFIIIEDEKTQNHHDELVKIDKNELNGLDFDYVELMRSISHQHIASVVELPSASDDQLLLAFHIDSNAKSLKGFKEESLQKNENLFASEENILRIIYQLIKAVEYLHSSLNVVHGFICPENIFVKNCGGTYEVVLGGSVFLEYLETHKQKSQIKRSEKLKAYYHKFRPEIDQQNIDFKYDIWCIGWILYEMCFNDDHENVAAKEKQLIISSSSISFPDQFKVVQLLFRKLTNINATERPSASQLLSMPMFFKTEKYYENQILDRKLSPGVAVLSSSFESKKKSSCIDGYKIIFEHMCNICATCMLARYPPVHTSKSYTKTNHLFESNNYGFFYKVIDRSSDKADLYLGLKRLKKRKGNHLNMDDVRELIQLKKHENLVSIVDYCESSFDVVFILEFIGKSLKETFDLLRERENTNREHFLELNELQSIMKQTMQGVEYLHTNELVHGRLNMSHLRLVNGEFKQIKILYLAFIINDEEHYEYDDYEKSYLAPEILQNGRDGDLAAAVDIWSLGCIFYELVSLRKAFDTTSLNLNDYFPRFAEMNPLRPLLDKMMRRTPSDREKIGPILNLFDQIDFKQHEEHILDVESALNEIKPLKPFESFSINSKQQESDDDEDDDEDRRNGSSATASSSSSEIKLDAVMKALHDDLFGLHDEKCELTKCLMRSNFSCVSTKAKEGFDKYVLLTGPEGVGKTSLVRSISNGLNRKFIRVNLRSTHLRESLEKLSLILEDQKSVIVLFTNLDCQIRDSDSDLVLNLIDGKFAQAIFLFEARVKKSVPLIFLERMHPIEFNVYKFEQKAQIVKFILGKRKHRYEMLTFDENVISLLIKSYCIETGVKLLVRKYLKGIFNESERVLEPTNQTKLIVNEKFLKDLFGSAVDQSIDSSVLIRNETILSSDDDKFPKGYRKVSNFPIGGGAFGEVFLVDNFKLNRRQVIKVLNPPMDLSKAATETYSKYLDYETDTLNKIKLHYNHKHIVNFYTFIPNIKSYLVFDYCNNGDLNSMIDKLRSSSSKEFRKIERLKLRWTYQIASGLSHLHTNEICHRDIKPKNILLHNYDIKIGDFGLARNLENLSKDARLTKPVGTLSYFCPELFSVMTEINARNVRAVDIWAFACTIYELFTYKRLFSTSSENLIKQGHKKLFAWNYGLFDCSDHEFVNEIYLKMLNQKIDIRRKFDVGMIVNHLRKYDVPAEFHL